METFKITKETQQKNLNLFFKKLSQLGIDVNCLEEKYGEKLMVATFTNANENGYAGEGTFLEVILKILTPYAVRINELLPEHKRINKETLVKICLLHQIAKAIRMIPNDNAWEVEKRGLIYKYDSSLPSIRTGLHSLIMCQECGITFTAEEAEAMTVNDRDMTDEQARWFSSILSTLVRQSSELTYLEINNKK